MRMPWSWEFAHVSMCRVLGRKLSICTASSRCWRQKIDVFFRNRLCYTCDVLSLCFVFGGFFFHFVIARPASSSTADATRTHADRLIPTDTDHRTLTCTLSHVPTYFVHVRCWLHEKEKIISRGGNYNTTERRWTDRRTLWAERKKKCCSSIPIYQQRWREKEKKKSPMSQWCVLLTVFLISSLRTIFFFCLMSRFLYHLHSLHFSSKVVSNEGDVGRYWDSSFHLSVRTYDIFQDIVCPSSLL